MNTAVPPVITGRMADLPEELAVFGEHLQRAGHTTPAAVRGQDVHDGGQVVQGGDAQSEQSATSHASGHATRPAGNFPEQQRPARSDSEMFGGVLGVEAGDFPQVGGEDCVFFLVFNFSIIFNNAY